MVAGQKHRLRFINLHTFETGLTAELKEGSTFGVWKALAKDGRDLPAGRQTERTSRQMISIGETFDFEFVAKAGGEYKIEMTNPRFNKVWTTIPIRVVQTPTRRAELVPPSGIKPESSWWSSLASLLPSMPAKASASPVPPLPSADGLFDPNCLPQQQAEVLSR
jgi:hypothetical protein